MPNGQIQPEFTDSLAAAGKWLEQYGETIYGTRGGPIAPQPWGVSTQKGKKIYLHLFKQPYGNMILLPGFKAKVKQVQVFINRQPVKFKQQAEGLILQTEGLDFDAADLVVQIELS
jgi:alpha-L-fucosidase